MIAPRRAPRLGSAWMAFACTVAVFVTAAGQAGHTHTPQGEAAQHRQGVVGLPEHVDAVMSLLHLHTLEETALEPGVDGRRHAEVARMLTHRVLIEDATLNGPGSNRRRATVGITVYPDKRVVVRAPGKTYCPVPVSG